MRVTAIAAFVAVLAAIAAGQSRETNTGFLDRSVIVGGLTCRFSVYVPSNYSPDKAWPILTDLHGNGAQGDDGIRQTAHFLADQIRLKRSRFPLIVVFPQAARGSTWGSSAMQEMVMAEIELASAEFHGDKKRTYLSGFSMGGDGVYDVAARWPDRFAALIAISALGPVDDGALVQRLHRLPLKIFHGAEDERVPVQAARRLVADLKKAGAAVEYTEYSDARHGPTAERTYANEALVDWLLAQHQH